MLATTGSGWVLLNPRGVRVESRRGRCKRYSNEGIALPKGGCGFKKLGTGGGESFKGIF